MNEILLFRLEQTRDACKDAIEVIKILKQKNKELSEKIEFLEEENESLKNEQSDVAVIESAVQQEREACKLVVVVAIAEVEVPIEEKIQNTEKRWRSNYGEERWLSVPLREAYRAIKDKNYYAIKTLFNLFWEKATPEEIAKLIDVAKNECGLHITLPIKDNKETSE